MSKEVTVLDRSIATIFSLVILASIIGGKSIGVGLFLMCGAALVCIFASTNTHFVTGYDYRWNTPIVYLFYFLAFAALSSTWALAPGRAIQSALLLTANLLATILLLMTISTRSQQALVLIGGWFVITFALGGILLLTELISGHAITRFIYNTFPWLVADEKNTMLIKHADAIIAINPAIGNWSVAAVALLSWPAVRIARIVFIGAHANAWTAALAALVTIIVFTSQHETSKIALVVGGLSFLLALFSIHAARRTLISAVILIIVAVAPISYTLLEHLHLHQAPWAQPSLRERFIIWGYTAEQVAKKPIIGIGANNTEAWMKQFVPRPHEVPHEPRPRTTSTHAHNIFLQTWFELGLIGACLLAGFAVTFLKRISHLEPTSVPYAAATATSAICLALAAWNLWHSWMTALFGVTLCWLLLADRLASTERLSFWSICMPSACNKSGNHLTITTPGAGSKERKTLDGTNR